MDLSSIGEEYINATQRMIWAEPDELLAAAEERQRAWGRVSIQAIRAATSFPGTTLSGEKPGIPTSGAEALWS